MNTIMLVGNKTDKEHLNVSMTYEQYQEYESKKNSKYDDVSIGDIAVGFVMFLFIIFLITALMMVICKFINWFGSLLNLDRKRR